MYGIIYLNIIINVFMDMVRIKKLKLSNNPAKKMALKREPMTKIKFIMSVLGGTIAVLTFTLIFTVYAAIMFFGHIKKNNIAQMSYQGYPEFGQVVYKNDKILYRPDDTINLNIVNETRESIYLAPCEYFNKFEKKVSDKWQSISLISCDESAASSSDTEPIEKISKKVEESIVAKKLGEGLWRGVSVVYFGCQQAKTISCSSNKTIYTDEFVIGEPGLAVSTKPEL